jgi:hypothetical protein
MPVELRLELGAVVGLHHVHAEWQAAEDFVDELNGGAWVARRATVWALAALALAATLAAAALGYVHLRETPPVARSLRLSVPIPDGASVAFLELSPDGTRVLLRLNTGDSNAIYVRSLEANDLQLLTGSENARAPFWPTEGMTLRLLLAKKAMNRRCATQRSWRSRSTR